MSAQWPQRCMLALLLAMSAALGAGLLAWGPIALEAHDRFAEGASLLGLAELANTLASLPLGGSASV